ncbi:hypothetical protein GO755_27660 [Spirosoma sp. HMF4905]|uniref:Uncharacterized protein n=1 Tax=Spirosoma arboris TaxID=2682092 RepID=A0A7K1SJD1_9BACT|nr:hypothetical protein [Spirosoma arboris]MVM33844.1 hypothetical protein [Spirosoma arboris]
MKKAMPYNQWVTITLTLLLTLLWGVSCLLVDYALVFTDFIQDKLPSKQALLQWATVS